MKLIGLKKLTCVNRYIIFWQLVSKVNSKIKLTKVTKINNVFFFIIIKDISTLF